MARRQLPFSMKENRLGLTPFAASEDCHELEANAEDYSHTREYWFNAHLA